METYKKGEFIWLVAPRPVTEGKYWLQAADMAAGTEALGSHLELQAH